MNTLIYPIYSKTTGIISRYINIDVDYFAKGSFWLGLRQGLAAVASLVTAVVFANFLPKETYGTYNYIHSVLGILVLFSLPGINTTLTQAVAKGLDRTVITALATKIRWSLLGSVVSTGIAVYYIFKGDIALGGIFIVLAIIFPFLFSYTLYDAYLQGKKLFRKSTEYEIIRQTIITLILIGAALISSNVVIIFLAYLIPQVLSLIIFHRKALQEIPPHGESDITALTYGKHVSVTNVLAVIGSYIDKLLVYAYLGPAQLAVYSFATLPVERINLLFSNFPSLAIPKLSEKTIGSINTMLYKRIFQLTLLGTAITLMYVVIAPFMYAVFFPKYNSSVGYSQLIALTLIFKVPTLLLSPLGQAKITLFPKKFLYLSSIIPQALFIVVLFILGKTFGIYGIILSRVLLAAVVLAVGLFNWKVLTKLHPDKTV